MKYLLLFLNKKLIIALSFLLLSIVLISFLELVGIGVLVVFVALLTDPDKYIMKIPISEIQIYLQSLSIEKLSLTMIIFLILFFIFKNLIYLLVKYLEIGFIHRLKLNLSKRLLKIYLIKPYIYHVNANSTEIINDIFVDSKKSIAFVMAVVILLRELLLISFLFFSFLLIDTKNTLLIFFILSIASLIFYSLIGSRLKTLSIQQKEKEELRLRYLNQAISEIKMVKLLNNIKFFVNRFLREEINYLSIEKKNYIISNLPRPYLETISLIVFSIIFVIVLSAQKTNINDLIPFLTFLSLTIIRCTPAFTNINVNLNTIKYNYVGIQNVYKEFKDHQKNHELLKDDNQQLDNDKLESFELKNISFRYKETENKILNNISFKLEKGETLGIIGKTGSGKTTLVDIILNLYTPQEGHIFLNNKEFKSIQTEYLNNLTAYVPQQIHLFNESIKVNIGFGQEDEEIDKDKIDEVIDFAQLNEFVKKLPNGIETMVGERGVRISGGERQRIGIARALFKNFQLLVLDEATSALDYETENKIVEKLNLLKKDRISIMIAHRISSLKQCDKILILEQGKTLDYGDLSYIKNKYKNLNQFLDFKN